MTNRYEDALEFCEMVLEIGMPEDTVIPVWPIETEMAITHPLTVGKVVKIRSALKLAQEAEQLRLKLSETAIHLAARNSEIEQLRKERSKLADAIVFLQSTLKFNHPIMDLAKKVAGE